jgi:hypothetical protein
LPAPTHALALRKSAERRENLSGRWAEDDAPAGGAHCSRENLPTLQRKPVNKPKSRRKPKPVPIFDHPLADGL